jgi:flagellar biosynthesis/type III secretory pathway protein FliH
MEHKDITQGEREFYELGYKRGYEEATRYAGQIFEKQTEKLNEILNRLGYDQNKGQRCPQ